MIKRTIFFATLWLAPAMASLPAHAAERLVFGENRSPSTALLLQKSADMLPAAYMTARADLNGDGLDELIARDSVCPDTSLSCRFDILAEADGALTPLGRIEARTLYVADSFTHGVRDLMAFQNGHNDYDYTVYVWEPLQSRYILKADTKDSRKALKE